MADEPDFDDDVQDLLGQLDESDADSYIVDKITVEADEYRGEPAELEGNPSGNLTVIAAPSPQPEKMPTAEELKPVDVRRADQMIAAAIAESAEPTAAEEPPIVDIRKELTALNEVVDEIIQGTRADRQEVQDAITLCRSEIDKSIQANGQPMRMWVDNLAKVLEVKASINMTAVKAMDSKAKHLAAIKVSSVNVQTNVQTNINTGKQDQSLIELLANNPLQPSDD